MEEKIKIIDEIVKLHPGYGAEKGWSWYVGGMRDTGDWYYRKMLDVPIEKLKAFLDAAISEKNKPKIELTGQDLIDSKTIIEFNGGWTTVYNMKCIEKHMNELERKAFFG